MFKKKGETSEWSGNVENKHSLCRGGGRVENKHSLCRGGEG